MTRNATKKLVAALEQARTMYIYGLSLVLEGVEEDSITWSRLRANRTRA